MSSDPGAVSAIRVKNVSKVFRLAGAGRSLKSVALELVGGGRRPGGRLLKALDDVSFVVPSGETLGIIGANGAGKSTLLAMLTGTIRPTSGTIATVGTISALLELGAGFHPDLTGRENVFLYGAIIGLSRRQMRERFEAIVEFAGLEEFIDQPVKHYSSGMYVRLGFAVAVEVDPDILLIDEVLAVGDADFQRKCLAKMAEFRERRKTMLVISHDLPTVQSVSDRILLLDAGRIIGLGDPETVVHTYESLARQRNADGMQREWGTGEVKITGVDFLDEEGTPTDRFRWNGPLRARVRYRSSQAIDDPVFGFAISDERGHPVHGNNTQLEGVRVPRIDGDGAIMLRIDRLGVGQGTYLFSFSVHSSDHKVNYHRIDNAFPVSVESDRYFDGFFYMPSTWEVTDS